MTGSSPGPRAITQRSPRRRAREALAAVGEYSGLPTWFYWLAAVSAAGAFLFPYAPVKYLILTVFGLVFLSFYSSAPERTLFVVVLGIPVLDLLPEQIVPVPGINAETIVILALALAVTISRDKQPPAGGKNPFLAPAVFFALVFTFSAFHAHYSGSAEVWTGWEWRRLGLVELLSSAKVVVFFVFLAPIAFRLLWDKKQVETVLNLIAVVVIAVSLHALWGIRNHLHHLERKRAEGLIGEHPNLFGPFLAMMIAIFLSLLLAKGIRKREGILYTSMIGVAALALICTLSRGAWLGLAIAAVYLALLRGAKMMAVVILVVGTAHLWLPEKVIERVKVTTGGDESVSSSYGEFDASTEVRLDQWRTLPEMWSEAPVLGHGLRSFTSRWSEFGLTRQPKAAHSTYVEILVEEGMLGLVALGWLAFVLLRSAWKVARQSNDPDLRAMAHGVVAALLALIFMELSGTRFTNRDVMSYIWILGGALARMSSQGQSERRTSSGRQVPAHRGRKAAQLPTIGAKRQPTLRSQASKRQNQLVQW